MSKVWQKGKRFLANSKRELISRTLGDDYPGLDYFGFHNIFSAKYIWYQILWFTLFFLCLACGIFTVISVIQEYSTKPTSTQIRIRSVENLTLPQLTICPTSASTIDTETLFHNLTSNETFLEHFGEVTEEDIRNFAVYILAGSGFQDNFRRQLGKLAVGYFGSLQKMPIESLTVEQRNLSDMIYNFLRGDQTVKDFFPQFFDTYGIQCEKFFHSCKLGPKTFNCCENFRPTYTIRRGRCFRVKHELQQLTFDEMGKLTVLLRQPPSMFPTKPELDTTQQLIAFVGENGKWDIAPFPRYYLYRNQALRLRLSARKLDLLPYAGECERETKVMSKSTCYLAKWFNDSLESVYQCTYPYMDKLRVTGLPSVLPEYFAFNATTGTVGGTTLSRRAALASSISDVVAFRVDLQYSDLQYEEFTEFKTITFLGLLAQIGGQLSLFIGCSILSIIQTFILTCVVGRRVAIHATERHAGGTLSEIVARRDGRGTGESAQGGSNPSHYDTLYGETPRADDDEDSKNKTVY